MDEAVADERYEIEANAVAYLTAFSRADVAAVLATYADDGVLMGPGRPATVGQENLAKVYPGIFEATSFDMTFEIQETVQVSADWAFVRSSTKGTETNKTTGAVTSSAYQELFLLRRSTGGRWQTARYCTTKISPTAQ